MPFTVVAFSESQDEANAYATLNAVTDPTVTVTGDTIYVPELDNLIGALACLGTTGVSAYLDSPSLRELAYYYIKPIEKALIPSAPPHLPFHPTLPVPLVRYEGIKAYVKADPAAAEQHTVVLFLSDGALTPVTGEIRNIEATASVTEAAGSWEEGSITFTQDLPAGRYQVVGARVECGGNGIAFRFIPVGGGYRAGGLCVNDVNERDPPFQRFGQLGVWFEFDPREPPMLEVLASAAGGTSQTIILDVIKVA